MKLQEEKNVRLRCGTPYATPHFESGEMWDAQKFA